MSFSLYSATVPPFRQTLGAVERLLIKAEDYCRDHDARPEAIIQSRLAPDMLPFSYQVKSTVVHSVGAIDGVRKGVFSPDMTPPPDSFSALKEQVSQAQQTLSDIDPNELNGFIGRDMCFRIGEFRLNFTAENFLVSFSIPNFYFHATTAYDLLRMQGLQIGKRDFMGQPLVKGAIS